MRLGSPRAITTSRSRPRRRNRRLLLFLLVPMLSGSFAAPSTPARGDELSAAKARQKALEQQIAQQKAQMAELSALQGQVKTQIASTSAKLDSINADLTV